jgi:hypothetical protein
MLIYGIVRVIVEHDSIPTLSCTFPKGNKYIDVELTWSGDGFTKVWKIKLDPGAPKEVSLTNIFGIVTYVEQQFMLFIVHMVCEFSSIS